MVTGVAIMGSTEVSAMVAVVPPPPMLKPMLSAPAPATQSPPVVSLSRLALRIASRRLHMPSPALATSRSVSTVIVASVRVSITAGSRTPVCKSTRSVNASGLSRIGKIAVVGSGRSDRTTMPASERVAPVSPRVIPATTSRR